MKIIAAHCEVEQSLRHLLALDLVLGVHDDGKLRAQVVEQLCELLDLLHMRFCGQPVCLEPTAPGTPQGAYQHYNKSRKIWLVESPSRNP